MSFDHVPGSSTIASNLAPFRTNADDLVNERFEYALGYADTAFAESLELMDAIKQMAERLEDIDVDSLFQPIQPPNPDFTETQEIPRPEDYGVTGDIVKELDPDALSFNWNPEEIYSSDLLNKIKSKCNTDMTSGTGISASVENDMINRETERDALINATARSEVSADFAEFGWSMPDGVLGYNLTQISTEYQNKRLDKSRDIRVESFNLAQKNVQFAVSSAIDVEKNLMSYKSGMMDRMLKAAIATVDIAIRVFEGQVAYFNARVALYNAVLSSYKALWELMSMEVRAQIDVFTASVQQAVAQANLIIEEARVEIAEYQERNKLRLAAMEGAARVASSVAAAALTGISAQAHISSSDSFSASGSVSYVGQETKYYDETTI